MRILRVIRSINPEGGGPVEGLFQTSQLIEKKGCKVEILCLDSECEVYVKNSPLKVNALGSGIGNYAYSRKIKRWLRENYYNYDVIIVHGMWQYLGLVVRDSLKGTGVPYLLFTHGMLDPWFKRNYPFKHIKKWLYWLFVEYRVVKDAGLVLFTTEEERVLAKQSFWLYSCNEFVINYGTYGQVGNIDEQRNKFINKFPNLKGKEFLLFLSRIHPKKGVDLLLNSLARIVKNNTHVELVIAGPNKGEYATKLKQHVDDIGLSNSVTWTGMLQDDLKWGAFLSADAFILPSHQENFGIVVAEALSCSTPVLISNKVNIWREIQKHEAGLVGDDTINGCAKLISEWLAMCEDRKDKMRKNARECFLMHFESGAAADSLIQAIDKVT